MKKFTALLMALAMIVSLAACGTTVTVNTEDGKAEIELGGEEAAGEEKSGDVQKFYVLGPTPDHGWTAQAGAYAQAKCEEITAEGKYEAVYMAASSGEEQVDQCNTIIANGDAALVVMMALEDSAAAGQEALIAENIPFIEFDRFILSTMDKALLNYSGNNYACGAGIAYWLQKNGMEPGATLCTLIGDNGSVCLYRQEGFEQFLRGELDYTDNETGETYHTAAVWTQEEIDALCATYNVVCNWSADGAYQYLEQKIDEITAAAKANNGKLFVFSEDDEMTFGFLNLLDAAAVSDETKADLEALEVYISAIGGMQELYDVMSGTSDQAATADQYFDDMMSVSFNPSMMKTVIDKAVDYLDGNWEYELGEEANEPVFIVDRTNVTNYEGFTGH